MTERINQIINPPHVNGLQATSVIAIKNCNITRAKAYAKLRKTQPLPEFLTANLKFDVHQIVISAATEAQVDYIYPDEFLCKENIYLWSVGTNPQDIIAVG